MARICIVYRERSPWVAKDAEILREKYDVEEVHFTNIKDIRRIRKLYEGVRCSDLTFMWFANDHSFITCQLAKLMRKPVIIALGGGDVTAIKSLNYGNLLRYPWKFYVARSLECADLVLAPSFFTRREVFMRLRKLNPNKILVLYHGFNPEKYAPHSSKENIILTIGFINKITIFRKGLIYFVRAAKLLPNVRFVVIGKPLDDAIKVLNSIAPPNVEFTGYLSEKDLIKFLQRAKVYVQASLHEGFGCAVAEAMLAENVPVVTRMSALPEVVGSTGIYVPYGDARALAKAIEKALSRPELGRKARIRATRLFNISRRKTILLKVINLLLERRDYGINIPPVSLG
ncbi:glycosyl transferase family 1 [candidate division Kazan bacterium]|uniref:Glycosyl transferase family 1 n=1 Tax=candidate division Kazan bacterium TaxID=2202143 RepID=A0A420ZCC2_UNCK3|nr:MAG: glycosyl transferase family 1 [candidate division Kazan bacterium]